MTETTTDAVARVHAESAERGRALIALAVQQNDVGGEGHPEITAMSAVTDLMHAVAAAGEDPAAMLSLARFHYQNDVEGTW